MKRVWPWMSRRISRKKACRSREQQASRGSLGPINRSHVNFSANVQGIIPCWGMPSAPVPRTSLKRLQALPPKAIGKFADRPYGRFCTFLATNAYRRPSRKRHGETHNAQCRLGPGPTVRGRPCLRKSRLPESRRYQNTLQEGCRETRAPMPPRSLRGSAPPKRGRRSTPEGSLCSRTSRKDCETPRYYRHNGTGRNLVFRT